MKVDRIWRCRCGAGHFLCLTWWAGDPSGFLEVEGQFRVTGWQRARTAARLLFTGHAFSHVGLVLNPETAAEVGKAIAEYVVASSPPPPQEPPWGPAPVPPELPADDLRRLTVWPL